MFSMCRPISLSVRISRYAITSRLIKIYTISHSVFFFFFFFDWRPQFATVDMSPFKSGRGHFRNLGMTWLTHVFPNCPSLLTVVLRLNSLLHSCVIFLFVSIDRSIDRPTDRSVRPPASPPIHASIYLSIVLNSI